MSTHQNDLNKRPDSDFIDGEYSHLVIGNKCRLLDGRRTEGFIENILTDSGMFKWRITKYEDSGSYWLMPFESITNFQFEKDSNIHGKDMVNELKSISSKLNISLEVPRNIEVSYQHNTLLIEGKDKAIEFLKHRPDFMELKDTQLNKIDTANFKGHPSLFSALDDFMHVYGLKELEDLTQKLMVLNPSSGEWIKGLLIVMAEMGLTSYKGKAVRSSNLFDGIGSKDNRAKYISYRLGFVRAYMELLGLEKVTLFRGMSTPYDWKKIHRSLLPCTFNYQVASDFSDLKVDGDYANSYIIKSSTPVDKVFMSFIETKAMNNQYNEAEAVILYNDEFCI